jgi:hypothetical protein
MQYVIAPLHNFIWDNRSYKIGQGVEIKYISEPIDFSPWNYLLSEDDKSQFDFDTHFLSIPTKGAFGHSYMDIMHLFLFCLWVVKYTQVQVHFVLEPSVGGQRTIRRICGHYRYVENKANSQVSTTDLDKTRLLLPIAARIYGKKHRLATALFFTHVMKTEDRWATAFISGINAIEALFSGDAKKGQTLTISRRLGAFLGKVKASQVGIGKRVLKLYDRRSELVHGRYVINLGDEKKARVHLNRLYQTERLLRRCWWKILTNASLCGILRKSRKRDNYLTSLAGHISKSDLN